jgi:hypothetical protein
MKIGRFPLLRAVVAIALVVIGAVFHHGLIELGGVVLLIFSAVQLVGARRKGPVR